MPFENNFEEITMCIVKENNNIESLLVNRVSSNRKNLKINNNATKTTENEQSKTERIRRALVKYRITPYLISMKRRALNDAFCDPTISVDQACELITRVQGEIRELEYVYGKTKRVIDGLSFLQRDMLLELEYGASCAEIAKQFEISSRTAFRLVSKMDELIGE